MGFQTHRYVKEDDQSKRGVHPIWRGIGCVFLVLIPIMSYFGSLVFLQYGPRYGLTGWISSDLLAKGADPLLYVKIGLTIAISLVFYAIFMIITFIINRLFGAPMYGPLDAPQELYKGREYKR